LITVPPAETEEVADGLRTRLGPELDRLLSPWALVCRVVENADSVGVIRAVPSTPPAQVPDERAQAILAEIWRRSHRLRPATAVLANRMGSVAEALSTLPPSAILGSEGADSLALALEASHETLRPAPRDGHTAAVLKITRLCNLRCRYCHDWSVAPGSSMTVQTQVAAIAWLAANGGHSIDIVIHGGEPSLAGPRSLARTAYLVSHLLPDRSVRLSVQTNAVRLREDYLEMLVGLGIHVGVSFDGLPAVHDAERIDSRGRPTAAAAMAGVAALRQRGVLSGAIVVVTRRLLDEDPTTILEHLSGMGLRAVAMIPARPGPNESDLAAYPAPEEYGAFLVDIRRARQRLGVPLYIRELDSALARLHGRASATCELAGNCIGSNFTIDTDGSVMHCDKYLGLANYRVDNIRREEAGGLGLSTRVGLLRAEYQRGIEQRRGCRWFGVCNGWCPHEWLTNESAGRPSTCCGLAEMFDALAHDHMTVAAP
jgi:uncharacterized protein